MPLGAGTDVLAGRHPDLEGYLRCHRRTVRLAADTIRSEVALRHAFCLVCKAACPVAIRESEPRRSQLRALWWRRQISGAAEITLLCQLRARARTGFAQG